jgi:GR25 family glycosyltransferase involved in LPS biosynthesis
MARGWESKSVEAQQDTAANQEQKAQKVTAEDSARRAERATLSLARARALADLQKACVAAHRAMLEQAIADLDKRLAALENPTSPIPGSKSQ